MRKLNDQWIEDGRMRKAVLPSFCELCVYNLGTVQSTGGVYCKNGSYCVTQTGHVKDLGPVNEEGCLAEERTGLYPEIWREEYLVEGKEYWHCSLCEMWVHVATYGKTKQEAIDAWNRRNVWA